MSAWGQLFQGDALSTAVVLVLLGMSVLSWVVILWKLWLLRLAGQSVDTAVGVFWAAPDWHTAETQVRHTDRAGLVGPLVAAAAASRSDGRQTLGGQSGPSHRLTRLLRDALAQAQQRLQWGQVVLASVGATAPFVGLLGTVWGIYHALMGMAAEGQVTIDKVSGPVGEALVMTAAGLGVAIPAVLAYNVLGRAAGRTEAALDAFAHDVREWVLQAPDGEQPSD
jgi:biopolymer transport protein ExbB